VIVTNIDVLEFKNYKLIIKGLFAMILKGVLSKNKKAETRVSAFLFCGECI